MKRPEWQKKPRRCNDPFNSDKKERNMYELVQVWNPWFRQPRIPHAIATRLSHTWYQVFGVVLTAMNRGRGWHSQFFLVKGPGLALAPKMCPDQSQAFKEVTNSQAFILDGPLPGAPRHVCTKFVVFSRKYSQNWLRRTNFMSNLTPKIEYTLKQSNYDAKPWFLYLTAQKSKSPRRFRESDVEISHTCLMCPCRAFYEWVLLFCFCFLFAENVGSLKTQIFQKIQKPKYLAEKRIVEGSAGAH